MKNRLIFIGLDAADTQLINSWASSGDLPAMAHVMKQANMIRINNEPGLFVGSVWPTITMGASSSYHGRYCWKQYRSGTYEDEFHQADQIHGVPVWDHLDRMGKSVCVIDIPKGLPGNYFKGRFVKDWGTHDPSSGGFRIFGWMSPREFLARYGRDEVGRCDDVSRTLSGFSQFRQQLVARAAARTEMILDLLREDCDDVIWPCYSEAHCMGHQCWHLHDTSHELHDARMLMDLGDPLRDIYVALDTSIGRILELRRECDTLILLATHGMGTNYNAVELLNRIIVDLEYDAMSPRDRARMETTDIPHLLVHDSIDFRRALRVFPVPNNSSYAAFRLNIIGREPDGKLPLESADSFLAQLQADLFGLTNADTGLPIFKSAVSRKTTPQGPHADQLPDLLMEWNRAHPIRKVVTPRSVLQNSYGGNPRTGDHKPEGGMWVFGRCASELNARTQMDSSEIASWILRISQ